METNEDLYRGLLEAAPDAMVGVTEDGLIMFVNAQAEALFGYDRSQLLGHTVEMLVPLAARGTHPRMRDSYHRAPSTRPMGEGGELAARRRDGSEFPAEISLSSLETPAGQVVLAVIRDGTERKQTAIINSSPDAIISTDLNGSITSWNLGAKALYGYTSSMMLGQHIHSLTPATDRAEVDWILGLAAAEGQVTEREVRHQRADGTRVDVEEVIAPLFDSSGAIVGISNIARDITERRRNRVERAALEDRLRQSERLESLGQLAGGVAHDFNNLLAVILNYASFIGEEVSDNPTVSQDVAEIRSAAERAVRLTQQLLIFARRETSTPELLDLDEVVADVQSLLSRTLGEHVELVVRRGDTPLHTEGDRGQLEQVLLNLAVNARDAMPGGGTLTIETGSVIVTHDGSPLHPGLSAGRYVQLSVSDTGSGMAPDTIDHAFEPFFTTKPKGAGTGLGLATVYGIVAEAGGTVVIYSELGLGTTIRAYLPHAERDSSAAVVGPEAAEAPMGAGETILVVEDEVAIRKVTARILERYGYNVIQAVDGPTAMATAAIYDIDLLLTDVVMPMMSGRELAARLAESGRPVRTLFMSGYSAGVLGPQRHLDDGVDLIQKPFTELQLIDRVHRALHST